MADTILGGDFTVYYDAENRQKRIKWTGSATGTRSVNELYSALQDLFDELTQLDDGTPMSAQTPTEYTIGIIDTGSKDPWFIDRDSVEHLFGGSIRTASWERVTGTNTGIVRITYALSGGFTTDFITSDIGKTVTSAAGDTGTLLDFNTTSSPKVAWIRPTNNTATHDWDSGSGQITVTGGTGDVNQTSAAVTGDSLWANIFTIGTIEAFTHIYVQQNNSLLVGYKSATDWWEDGHIDVLVSVKEVGTEIDEAVVKVYARQHTKTYDHFEVDLTAGGRNPVPLSTGNDLDNQVGTFQMVLTTAAGGDFTVGNRIRDDSDSTIEGVITSVSGSGANQTIEYYLIGDPLNNFGAGTGAFTEYDEDNVSTGVSATAVAPTSVNSSTWSDVTVTLGANSTFDVDENDSTENYSVVVDCGTRTSLEQVYQRLKFITRRGEASDIDSSAQAYTDEGQFYIGSDRRLTYSGSVTGSINEGNIVVQANTGATGRVVAHHTSAKIIILRNSRGTFNTTDVVTDQTTFGTVTPNSGAKVIAPFKTAPFGTFAGGKFFGAPGVVLDGVPSADASNYQLIDDTGTVVVPPTKVSVTVANTRAGDKVAVFRLTEANGIIEKDRYAINSDAAAGATSLTVTPSITIDEPGKTVGGVLRVVDVSAQTEYRIRFASWTGSVFTLASTTGLTADAGTNATTIVDAGGSFNTNARVGDLIRNVTAGGFGYVVSVDSDTQITTTSISGQTTGDSYQINTVPVALEDASPGPADTLYVPFIDSYETTGTSGTPGSESSTITFDTSVPVRVRARNAGNILPFEQDSTIGGTGMSVSIIRTPDSIFTA